MDAFCVNRSLEGRIGQAHGKLFGNLILFRHAVLIVDFRGADGMQHEVHGRNAEHGEVGVETCECGS